MIWESLRRLSRFRLARFAVVGVLNSAVDLSVFWILVLLGNMPLLANVFGWLAAVVVSYILNSRWTFDRDRNLGEATSIFRFMVSGAIVTLLVSSVVLLALDGLIGVMPAKVLGILIAAGINFLAARWSIENRLL